MVPRSYSILASNYSLLVIDDQHLDSMSFYVLFMPVTGFHDKIWSLKPLKSILTLLLLLLLSC